MRRIGVWGVCDTGGLTAVLRSALPDEEIIPFVEPDSAEALPGFFSSLRDVDLLLVGRSHEEALRRIPDLKDAPTILYPRFMFDAFHPDCCYLFRRRLDGGADPFFNPHYHSAIIVWCYLNEVPMGKVPALFRTEVFWELGYFGRWDSNVDFWRKEFDHCGFDFDRFFLRVKRFGVFMHSINHPKVEVFSPFARVLADRISAKSRRGDGPFYVPDALASLVWPVYPEVAEAYGLAGSYQWNVEGRAMGVPEYVEWAYGHYPKVLPRDELVFEWRTFFDQALGSFI